MFFFLKQNAVKQRSVVSKNIAECSAKWTGVYIQLKITQKPLRNEMKRDRDLK